MPRTGASYKITTRETSSDTKLRLLPRNNISRGCILFRHILTAALAINKHRDRGRITEEKQCFPWAKSDYIARPQYGNGKVFDVLKSYDLMDKRFSCPVINVDLEESRYWDGIVRKLCSLGCSLMYFDVYFVSNCIFSNGWFELFSFIYFNIM